MARNRLLLRIDLLNKSRWSGHAIWQITGDALGADLARTPTTPDPRKSYVLTERQIALKRPSGGSGSGAYLFSSSCAQKGRAAARVRSGLATQASLDGLCSDVQT